MPPLREAFRPGGHAPTRERPESCKSHRPTESNCHPTMAGREPFGIASRELGWAVASTALCLLIAEASARALVVADQFYVWPPNIEITYEPDPGVITGVHDRSILRTNSLGMRSDEIPDDDGAYRILAVGGSTTECSFLDQAEAWPQLMQESLSVGIRGQTWVGNLGASGRNSRDHVLQLKHLLPRLPRIDAIVVLAGVNDLSLRLKRDIDYDPKYMQRPGAATLQLGHAFWRVPFDYEAAVYKRTVLYHLARELKNSVRSRLTAATYIDGAGRMYERWRAHRRDAVEIRDRLPEMATALAEYEDNIDAIVDLAQGHGALLLLVTQPSAWRPDMTAAEQGLLWLGGVGQYQELPGRPYYSVEALAEGMQAYNDVLLDTCRRRGVECIDLAAELPRDSTTFFDDVHFTEAGSAHVGRLVAAHLSQLVF